MVGILRGSGRNSVQKLSSRLSGILTTCPLADFPHCNFDRRLSAAHRATKYIVIFLVSRRIVARRSRMCPPCRMNVCFEWIGSRLRVPLAIFPMAVTKVFCKMKVAVSQGPGVAPRGGVVNYSTGASSHPTFCGSFRGVVFDPVLR